MATSNREAEKLKSQEFRLGSLQDEGGQSMLQEDLQSQTKDDNYIASELQKILQPDFIKSIGLKQNGEVLPSSPMDTSKVSSSMRNSRLDRRLECQNTRVVKPNSPFATQQMQ